MEILLNKSKFILEFIKIHFFNIRKPSNDEIRCLNIVSASLIDSDSKILFEPKNEERVILCQHRNISILIENRYVTIAHKNNHRSFYIDNTKLYDEMIKKFDLRLNKEFEIMKNQIDESKEKFFSEVFDYI